MIKSRLFVLAVAALVSTAGIAGAQVATTGQARAERGARGERGLLRGLKLTADQKAKVREVHGRYKAEGQSLRESMQPAMQEARAAREKGDTATARAILARTEGGREKLRALMLRESNDVRGILAADQLKQFDANMQVAKASRGKHGKGKFGRGNSVNQSANG